MNLAKKKLSLFCCIVFLIVLISSVILIGQVQTANASIAGLDNLVFTQVTNSDGTNSYKVAVKSTVRPVIEFVVIPQTYNGLPVTEIADNGFMSCSNLEKIFLPMSVIKVGNNAFMNCAKLRRIGLSRVQIIGNNAFGMCITLDKLFIPRTVKTVGMSILRNNTNTVHIQNGSETLGDGWQPTWNDYHTGEILYDARPEAALEYRGIFDDQKKNIVGYELSEWQMVATPEEDIVIYNAYRPNEQSEYKPLLNICSEAFLFASANSITIKEVYEDDALIPKFNHKINICSNAFISSFVNSVNIEVGITMVQSEDVQGQLISMFDGQPIASDQYGKSIRIFEESIIKSVTLPADTDLISDSMFYNCAYLNSIKVMGTEYDGVNLLPNISRIGAFAFGSCYNLSNISVPTTVMALGSSAFYEWGVGGSAQDINIDKYKDELPVGWESNWASEITSAFVSINYKPLIEVVLNLQDEMGSTIVINVKPDRPMPEIEKPNRNGYAFKGIYSNINGNGFQYYTSNLESARNWNINYIPIIYVHWQEGCSVVELNDGTNATIVQAKFGDPMPAAIKPMRDGYLFKGYYYINEDNTHTYYYTSNMESAKNWDINGDVMLYADWAVIEYDINYANLLNGTNPSSNPTTYTIESDTINFANLAGRAGYVGSWDTASIPVGSTGNKTITAVWALEEYSITYANLLNGTNSSNNPTTYTIESGITNFANPIRTGYTGMWDMTNIPANSTGHKTITAVWTLEEYSITYANLQNGTNPSSNPAMYTIESEAIIFTAPTKTGYTGTWDTASISAGSTGHVTITATWTPKNYTITFETKEGNSISPSQKEVEFGSSVGSLPTPIWSGHRFLGWSTNVYGTVDITSNTIYNNANHMRIYAQWEYTVTFNSNGGITISPMKGVYGTLIILPQSSRGGYIFNGWTDADKVTINGETTYQSTIWGDATLNANWTPTQYNLEIVFSSADIGFSYSLFPQNFKWEYKVSYDEVVYITAPEIKGFTFLNWGYTVFHGAGKLTIHSNYCTSSTISILNFSAKSEFIELSGSYTKNSCVAEGTLITLADGSQKAVETLTGNEQLLVWNLKTGKFDTAPMLFNDFDPARDYEVINLYFSDGTTVKVISEHAFWDFDLNKYVFLRRDAAQYIGHSFNKQITDANGNLAWTSVKLINVIVATEYTTAWSPVTESHLCFYVNGMLSMPGATEGLINIFDVNGETMQYDQDAFDADIAEYGLFTYEELNELVAIPEEMFDAFDLKYMKVSIGKGLITLETLNQLVAAYVSIFSDNL